MVQAIGMIRYEQGIERFIYLWVVVKDDELLSTTIPSCHGSSLTDIIIWCQYVTVQSETHGIYAHRYYCFRPEAND